MKKLLNYILLLIFFGCIYVRPDAEFSGFWKGPHPKDANRDFYIQIENSNDYVNAAGYWTENNFYRSEFKIKSIAFKKDSIYFTIPDWQCFYKGKLVEKDKISGGFSCTDEPFDKVIITRNNEIEKYLVLSKPGLRDPSFQYSPSLPQKLMDNIQIDSFYSENDSLFIYSLIPEIINGNYGRINSFLLFKNNKLLCEEYFYGYSNSNLYQIESCTKSLTSLIIGIAKDKGFIKDLYEPIHKNFSEYKHLKNGAYRYITIDNLLSMTSGFDPQNDELFSSENRIDYALKRPVINQPGTTFKYDGGNTEILGAILKVKTGMYADEFAKKFLFEPLNIKKYNWNMLKEDDYPSMAGSLHLRPRDMLKIGILVLNNGTFNNQKIISAEWIMESTSVKIKTHIPEDDYSYLWWNLNLKSKDKIYKTIWANGLGSQFVYIIPELETVIVTTGYNYEYDSWAITNGICKYLYLLDSNN